ncbi:interleukin-1 receptor accessory protein-like [Salarias fasciatus]|uniref:interleukin-1 receptor accessory protein-like n=1 Tax=Salarias fasciatus TaxID=181472 RepID=UPI0011769349|nr:interleukin-1 receptor accessory protein-like [Salarias fasciatus]
MASFICSLLLLLLLMGGAYPAVNQSSHLTESRCDDWGESPAAAVSVLEGEVGWLFCPLFSHPSVYNFTSTQSAGHNLFWYRLPEGHDLEHPIAKSSRLIKDKETLWLQPAQFNDSGQYICMLRNKSSCSKMAMRLSVLRPDAVQRGSSCEPPVAVAPIQTIIPLQEGVTLDCPDLRDAAKMADSPPNVTWYHVKRAQSRCRQYPFGNSDRQQEGSSLHFYRMLALYQGLYFCTAQLQRGRHTLRFTRSINVTAVYPQTLSKEPSVLRPALGEPIPVTTDSEVHLVCRGLFPVILQSPWMDIWWTVDGMTLDKLPDHQRFTQTVSQVEYDFGDLTMENVLQVQRFSSRDLDREFNCSVRNARGFESRRAQLQEEGSLPSVELGCGLGVTLVFMLLLFVVYHVFWLELLLLYRSWFGSDERHTDDKEYDVYISYARNSEEEHFVLSTLRSVLENELGYSVCIFDRDSLPGGTITDETLGFVARSRRLLVVISPGYASQGSQALLELKAGLDGMALGGHLRVILVQYRPLRRQVWVRELRRARVALALVRWRGDESREITSRFWKRLRVELPLRERGGRGREDGGNKTLMLRLLSQNSTNSQTGLISNTQKEPSQVLNCAI